MTNEALRQGLGAYVRELQTGCCGGLSGADSPAPCSELR